MIDPTGKLIAEIRADAAVTAIAADRIRGGEPAKGDSTKPYQAFVVITRLGTQRHPRLPIQTVRIGFNCYGATLQAAAALYGAVSDAIHNVGPRISGGATKIVIYRSLDDAGGSAQKDPETGQPFESGVVALAAATQAAP